MALMIRSRTMIICFERPSIVIISKSAVILSASQVCNLIHSLELVQ